MTAHDIARWRVRGQRLVAPHAASSSEVVSGLLAVQAENAGQAAWAVACRTARADPADLASLLDTGAVVRTHVLRPTWHFVAAVDVAWLLELTAPRVRPLVVRQLTEGHGWTAEELDRATSALLDVLAERPDRSRDDIAHELGERGVPVEGQRLMLLLAAAELDRLVCSGRPHERAHTYALFADRVPATPRLDREAALGELAWRYFSGHGPATERDLAYWATLPVTDVRRGLAAVRDRLASFELEDRTFWHDPATAPPQGPQQPEGHLLQLLDETYRGYQDSRMVLDVEGVVPTGRETAIGMALVDAQLVARMRRTVGRRVVFELEPYREALRAEERQALEEAAGRYGAFLGLEPELVVRR